MFRGGVVLFQTMILVHMVDGHPIALNMDQVLTVALPTSNVTDKSKCLITFIGGRFVNTKETCTEVRELWQHEDAKTK